MKTRITVALIAALFANVAAAGEGYWNNIDNGFDKMVYAQKDQAQYWAGVGASFDNMLNHTPYYGPTEVTVARQQDHRVDRLIHALRNEKPAATELVAAEGDDAKGGSL